MKEIMYVDYVSDAVNKEISENDLIKLQKDIKMGIDVKKPSVFLISYQEFLSKNLGVKNYYNVLRSMSENSFGRIDDSASEMIERMYEICNNIKNGEELNRFDLVFCELLLNPFAFSFYFTQTQAFNEWPKGVIFCLKDRINKDAMFVWGNEPYYYWSGAYAVLCDDIQQVRNCIKGVFEKISSEKDYQRFLDIFDEFKLLGSNYIKENKNQLFLDDAGRYCFEPNTAQMDYIKSNYNIKPRHKK